ncbi:hypothetical protein ACTZWW_11620 [Salinarimonas sp. NSM]|uniref:hypothetical protein n=1 Tax=Salinarimonas sp. NSM TaxID=3458003 RepID=UPI0040358842
MAILGGALDIGSKILGGGGEGGGIFGGLMNKMLPGIGEFASIITNPGAFMEQLGSNPMGTIMGLAAKAGEAGLLGPWGKVGAMAYGALQGQGLSDLQAGSMLEQLGVDPQSAIFGSASQVIGAVSRGEMDEQTGMDALSTLAGLDPALESALTTIGGGGFDFGSLLSGALTGGFGGLPGAGGFLRD